MCLRDGSCASEGKRLMGAEDMLARAMPGGSWQPHTHEPRTWTPGDSPVLPPVPDCCYPPDARPLKPWPRFRLFRWRR